MATPRRRSSRLHANVTPSRGNATSLSKLSSLLERDDSPTEIPITMDTVVSTPMVPPNTAASQRRFDRPFSAMNTPQTTTRVSFSEMHPSKVHQSTAKPQRSQYLPLAKDVLQSPSKPVTLADTQATPSKGNESRLSTMSSPTFNFTFERPDSDLSAEAQKIMNSVREEAARIKAQMIEEREKQNGKDQDLRRVCPVPGRKIAKATGTSGRFSDVHRQQFQKMDSITQHVSTWKTKSRPVTPNLKRTSSRAELDEITPKPMAKSLSKPLPSLKLPAPTSNSSQERLENDSPVKRARREYNQDKVATPSRSRDHDLGNPVSVQTESRLPSAVTTPTKSSLARSASVKSLKTTMIPSLSRSSSTKTLANSAPKSEGSNKHLNSLSRFGGIKSILHRTQPREVGYWPRNAAEGVSMLPKPRNITEKELPSLPSSPSKQTSTPSTVKRVGYPSLPKDQLLDSPSRIPNPVTILVDHPEQPDSPSNSSVTMSEDSITYPLLPTSPNVTTRRPGLPRPTTGPGDFTFCAEKIIKFSSDINKPLPPKPNNTIRHVRPSGLPTPLPASSDRLPAIQHGIGNKKRKHIEAEDSDLSERTIFEVGKDLIAAEKNAAEVVADTASGDSNGPHSKKQRLNPPPGVSSPVKLDQVNKTSPLKRRFGGALSSSSTGREGAKKKGLSLGRLNVLARPKERR